MNPRTAVTIERDFDDPSDFDELPADDMAWFFAWAERHVRRARPGERRSHDSDYAIKHMIQKSRGSYVSPGQAKGLLLTLGFEPVNRRKKNWTFRDLVLVDTSIEEAIAP